MNVTVRYTSVLPRLVVQKSFMRINWLAEERASQMDNFALEICVAAVIAIILLFIYRRQKISAPVDEPPSDGNNGMVITQYTAKLSQSSEKPNDLVIQVETLPVEALTDKSKLVEITDNNVLTRISNLIPALAQASLSDYNALHGSDAKGEVLYRAIIPAGAKLTNSRAMSGAVRGFYRDANKIQGHANLVPCHSQGGIALANAIAPAMQLASLVVGQYYMSQIHISLNKLSTDISKISDFQNNEFESRVFSLIAHIVKIADFQAEILENDELRQSKINQLNNLEEECTQLLGQVNLTLKSCSQKSDLDYNAYEKALKEAHSWYTYQQALLNVLYRLSDLKYALHLGNVSKEQCVALLPIYTKHVQDTQASLTEWHLTSVKRLGIDTDEARRKRAGLDGAIHFIPGLFNHDFNFKAIDEKTASMITTQASTKLIESSGIASDLYDEDVQLISKDGKIYYLPMDATEQK